MAKKILTLFIAAIAVAIFGLSEKAYAESWTDSTDIRFSEMAQSTDASFLPKARFGNNIECKDRLFTIRPERRLLGFLQYSELNQSDCVVNTMYGPVGMTYFQKSGSDVAGKFYMRSPSEILVPAPNSHNALIFTGGKYTFSRNVSIITDALEKINTVELFDGQVSYKFHPATEALDLFDAKGNWLTANTDSIASSSNGQWMVMDSPYYGHVRVNMSTGELLSFGKPTDYRVGGYTPNYKLAISSDGRYAVISTRDYLKIYDLEQCQDQTGALSYLKDCVSRDLEVIRKQQANFGCIRLQKLHIFYVLAPNQHNLTCNT